MERVSHRYAGLDVHKDTVVACVRGPGPRGDREAVTQTFGTTTEPLLALRDWLAAHGVTVVAMESTGVYWKPIYYLLEDTIECRLFNAHHLRRVPGRKTDVSDAAWIAWLVEHGLVQASFVPPKAIRELRQLTRYRAAQVEERTREAQRLAKVRQDAGVKRSSGASDVLGASGRARLDALVAGPRDPAGLAALAKGALRKKLPALRAALQGRFGAHHALRVGTILAKLDFLDEALAQLSQEIATVIGPCAAALALRKTIPGVEQRTAEGLIAELGVTMTQCGRAARLAAWAGLCPGHHESAGKRTSGKTRPGSTWLRAYLRQAAKAAGKATGPYLAAQYARLRGRRGPAKATVAVGHSMLVAASHILDRHQPYADLGADSFLRRHSPAHHARRLVRQLQTLGYRVTLDPTGAAA